VIYSVLHTTFYDFSGPVFLEPHILRLYPRCDGTQKIIEHDLTITPSPAGLSRGLDIWGNSFALAWFDGLHQHFRINSSLRIQTRRKNPFDYFLPEQARTLPVVLEPHEKTDLHSSLQRISSADLNTDPVADMALSLAKTSDNSTISFLNSLNSWIFTNFQRIERLEPGIIDPIELMKDPKGSCRDLAVLFIEICRLSGIPARLVSGYQEGDPDIAEAELHAWAEAYLPGAGWRGYDPTHGLTVADRHIPLAGAPEPENTMPLSGSFRGTEISSRIRHRVTMTTDDQA